MRKINNFKKWRVKSRIHLKDLWKFKFFLDDAKNAKNDANILKTYFFGFSLFFTIFGFSENFIKKIGQNLGNNIVYEGGNLGFIGSVSTTSGTG